MSDKFDIVDPIDRVFPPPPDVEGTNQAIEVATLKKELKDLSAIDGTKLNAPLSPAIMSKLDDLFIAEDKKCNEILKEYIEEAKINKDFDKNISNHEQFKKYKSSLQFLREYKLLKDANQRYLNFKAYVQNCHDMIKRAKEFT